MKLRSIILFLLSFTILSCGKESFDPEESFKYWTQYSDVPKEIKVKNGQFWKSPHFTYEYITYLEFKAPQKWIDEFIRVNNLKIAVGDYSLPEDAPRWFKPKVGQKAYMQDTFSQGSIYFVDEENNEMLIYEIQL